MSFAPVSFGVVATLTAYRIVRLKSGNTVDYATATASDVPIGVTTDDVKDITQAIPVQTHGIAKVYMGDSCAAGAKVSFNATGQGVPLVATTAGAWFIGILVGNTVAKAGTLADVLIMPGFFCTNP